jgi:G3E family GTPase
VWYERLPQILSKAPLFTGGEQKLMEIKTLIQKLNPTARVLVPREDKYGDLDVGKELMLTGLFDMEQACTSAGWLQELAAPEHTPETEEYGISSTIFRAKEMPFHPMRLNSILDGFGDYGSAVDAGAGRSTDGKSAAFSGVVRAKGKLWLANAHSFPIEFHVAGKHVQTTAAEAPYLSALEKHSKGGSAGAEGATLMSV